MFLAKIEKNMRCMVEKTFIVLENILIFRNRFSVELEMLTIATEVVTMLLDAGRTGIFAISLQKSVLKSALQ